MLGSRGLNAERGVDTGRTDLCYQSSWQLCVHLLGQLPERDLQLMLHALYTGYLNGHSLLEDWSYFVFSGMTQDQDFLLFVLKKIKEMTRFSPVGMA